MELIPLSIHEALSNAPPKLTHILPGLLRDHVGVLCGTGGTGKTTLAQQVAVSLACGIPTAGRPRSHPPQRPRQYLSIRYSERLAEVGIEASVGSVGDSYDNALAETIIGLYKAEVIYARGPWRTHDAVEYSTLEWVGWFNHRRLLESIGNVPPAEYEQAYYRLNESQAMAAGLNHRSLRYFRSGSSLESAG